MTEKPLIGILGGMGTSAGLYFQNLFFELCNQRGISGDQNYPEWLYLNASLAPDRTAAIKGEGDSPIPYLISMLKKMQSAGVTALVVTCNTAHVFFEEIISEVSLPWIHLPFETSLMLQKNSISKIGLLTTEGTLISGIYRKTFSKTGIQVIEPSFCSELQVKVMDAIYNKNYGIKYTGSQLSKEAKQHIIQAVEELNVNDILIGCTELSLAFSHIDLPLKTFDPMKIAAQSLFDVWNGSRSLESLKPSLT